MSDPAAVAQMSAAEIARRIRSGDTSPTAVVEAALSRAERLEPRLRAWVHLDADGALQAAGVLAKESRSGRMRGPLHGVPVAVKDIFDVAGMVTTSGAASFAHRRSVPDAPSIARLRQSGAVILGKTATTQFAFADPAETRNPWNLDHSPGGSSSGSAAVVAARIVPAALGSQTIGSTLRPASYCGIVGLKPTHGAISTEGVTPLSWSLDHVGIFARTVDDAALLFSVLMGTSAGSPSPRGARPPAFAIPRAFVEAVATREVKDNLAAATDVLAGAGARIEDVALPGSADQIDEVGRIVLRAEAAAFHSTWFSAHAAQYAPRIRELVEAGLNVSAVDFVRADQARHRFRQDMAPIFDRYDALLMPAAPATAPPLSLGTTGDPILCAPWSFGGFPAIAIPSGLSAERLPMAIQLVSGADAEQRLLEVAKWCQDRLNFTAEPKL